MQKKGCKEPTLCWNCSNLRCSWHRDCTPVEGWKAKPTKIRYIRTESLDSFYVIKCPEFIPDRDYVPPKTIRQKKRKIRQQYIEVRGYIKRIGEWAKIMELDEEVIDWRLRHGWDNESAVLIPAGKDIDGEKRELPGEDSLRKKEKKVRCVETGVVFKSRAEAARTMKLRPQNLSAAITGKSNTCGGYHWEEYTEKE